MNKILFNIIVWPLLLVASCFTAFGISTTNKLKAENLSLTEQMNTRVNLNIVNGIFKISNGSNNVIIQFENSKTLNAIIDTRSGTWATTDRRQIIYNAPYSVNQNNEIYILESRYFLTYRLIPDNENNTYTFASSSSGGVIEKLGDEIYNLNDILDEINAELGYTNSDEIVCTYQLNSVVKADTAYAWNVRFNSNSQDFTKFWIAGTSFFKFNDTSVAEATASGLKVKDEYLVVKFYDKPSGDLLIWLNSNAVLIA